MSTRPLGNKGLSMSRLDSEAMRLRMEMRRLGLPVPDDSPDQIINRQMSANFAQMYGGAAPASRPVGPQPMVGPQPQRQAAAPAPVQAAAPAPQAPGPMGPPDPLDRAGKARTALGDERAAVMRGFAALGPSYGQTPQQAAQREALTQRRRVLDRDLGALGRAANPYTPMTPEQEARSRASILEMTRLNEANGTIGPTVPVQPMTVQDFDRAAQARRLGVSPMELEAMERLRDGQGSAAPPVNPASLPGMVGPEAPPSYRLERSLPPIRTPQEYAEAVALAERQNQQSQAAAREVIGRFDVRDAERLAMEQLERDRAAAERDRTLAGMGAETAQARAAAALAGQAASPEAIALENQLRMKDAERRLIEANTAATTATAQGQVAGIQSNQVVRDAQRQATTTEAEAPEVQAALARVFENMGRLQGSTVVPTERSSNMVAGFVTDVDNLLKVIESSSPQARQIIGQRVRELLGRGDGIASNIRQSILRQFVGDEGRVLTDRVEQAIAKLRAATGGQS